MIFHENRLLAEESHELSCLISLKIRKNITNMSSAAVVIGALRVNFDHSYILLLTDKKQFGS